MNRIFEDDPEAIPKLEEKLSKLQKEHTYWKSLKPEPRTYQINETDNMKRWYMLPLVSKNVLDVKKKIARIQSRQNAGIELIRKPTYKDGRKCFFYEEVKA